MARRAAESATATADANTVVEARDRRPAKPQKRTTRARTKTQTNERDGGDESDAHVAADDAGVTDVEKAAATTTTTTTTTGRKRGRPKGSGKGKSGTTRTGETAPATATAKAKAKTKTKTETGLDPYDAEERGACSSDDEMDVVTVTRAAGRGGAVTAGPGSRGGTRMGSRSAKGAVAGGRDASASSASAGAKSKGRPRTAQNASELDGEDDNDDDDDDELAQLDVSQPRGGIRSKNGASVRGAAPATTTTATRPRGRPRKTATAASDKSKPASAAPRQSKRVTATTATGTAPAPAPAPAPAQTTSSMTTTAKPKPKKKVTFLDFTEPPGKENVPAAAPAELKAAQKVASTGMAAKPARPATPGAPKPADVTRGRKHVADPASTSASADGQAPTTGPAPPKEPLSPKKATQVAKSGSSGSSDSAAESDEQRLDGGGSKRSPGGRETRSPVKQVSSMSASFGSPAKKVDIGTPVQPTTPGESSGQAHQHHQSTEKEHGNEDKFSPSKQSESNEVCLKDSTIAASPARRPPSSPYKDLMKKESPRKAPLLIPPDGSSSSSPKRSGGDAKSSPLKLSPRKVQIGGTPARDRRLSSTPGRQTDKTASLLLTPAKRPVLAPTPLSLQSRSSPGVDGFQGSPQMRSPGGHEEERSQGLSPEAPPTDVIAEMDAQGGDSDQIVDSGLGCNQLSDMDESVLDISHLDDRQQHEQDGTTGSPPKFIQDLQVDADDPFVISEANSAVTTPQRNSDITTADSSVDSIRSFRGVPPPAPSPPVLSGVTSPPQRFAYRDEMETGESDAESCMDASPSNGSPIAVERRLSQQERPGPDDKEEDLGLTPLAAKLSQWSATSPEKRQPRRYHVPGPFSPFPAAAGKRPRDSLESRHSMDVRRRSKGERMSRVSSANTAAEGAPGTPTLTRLFDRGRDEDRMEDNDDSSICMDDGLTEYDEQTPHGGTMNISILEQAEDVSYEGETGFVDDDAEEEEEAYGDENAVPISNPTVTLPANLFEENNTGKQSPVQHDSHTGPLPMSVTPVRRDPMQPRTAHTISKVPLRPDGDGTLNISKKRSRSLSSGGLKSGQIHPSPRRSNRTPLKSVDLKEARESGPSPSVTEEEEKEEEEEKGATPQQSPARSPAKSTARKRQGGTDRVLRGAVVYTDVHTSEGSDAGGIFVELLTQMGARCVKSWGWNPRTASLSPPADHHDGDGDGDRPDSGAAEATKIGITHVVYKDGGVRTLEKVREANGVVKCVGVGWVLDCERASRWLDEAEYVVDCNIPPRGGQKRRKSMEPRALENKNGSIIKLDSSTSSLGSSRRSTTGPAEQDAAVQELRRLSPSPSPAPTPQGSMSTPSRRESSSPSSSRRRREKQKQRRRSTIGRTVRFAPHEHHQKRQSQSGYSSPALVSPSSQHSSSSIQPPATPSFTFACPTKLDDGGDNNMNPTTSPTTPFYLSQRAQLVQQTCPPRQLREGLFDSQACGTEFEQQGVGGADADMDAGCEMSAGLRSRLEAAKRRSLVWRPKVGSPLAK